MEWVMKRRLGATLAVLALTAGGIGVAGCGGDSSASGTAAAASGTAAADNGIASLGADEILAKASAAATQASSVRITGDITQGGEHLTLNVMVGNDAATGTLGIKGQKVEVRLVKNTFYMRAPAAFYQSLVKTGGAAIGQLVAGKWFSVPLNGSGTAERLAAFQTFTDKEKFFGSLLGTADNATVKGPGDVDGQPVVLLADKTNGTLAVATTGEPYPVQIAGEGDGSSGTLTFTDWNAPVNASAPSDVIDISGLLGATGSGSGNTTSTGN